MGQNGSDGFDAILFHRLNQRGLFFLSDLISHWVLGAPIWKSTHSIGLQIPYIDKWVLFVGSLQSVGFSYKREGDRIIWDGSMRENGIHVHELYLYIIND